MIILVKLDQAKKISNLVDQLLSLCYDPFKRVSPVVPASRSPGFPAIPSLSLTPVVQFVRHVYLYLPADLCRSLRDKAAFGQLCRPTLLISISKPSAGHHRIISFWETWWILHRSLPSTTVCRPRPIQSPPMFSRPWAQSRRRHNSDRCPICSMWQCIV